MNITKRFSSTFKIYRNNNNKVKIDSFSINKKEVGPMVLDGLIHIKNNIDKSLGFRRSCREGICGSCAMNINGKNTLACLTPIEDKITIFPLPHMPIVRDLIPDMKNFYKQYKERTGKSHLTQEHEFSDFFKNEKYVCTHMISPDDS